MDATPDMVKAVLRLIVGDDDLGVVSPFMARQTIRCVLLTYIHGRVVDNETPLDRLYDILDIVLSKDIGLDFSYATYKKTRPTGQSKKKAAADAEDDGDDEFVASGSDEDEEESEEEDDAGGIDRATVRTGPAREATKKKKGVEVQTEAQKAAARELAEQKKLRLAGERSLKAEDKQNTTRYNDAKRALIPMPAAHLSLPVIFDQLNNNVGLKDQLPPRQYQNGNLAILMQLFTVNTIERLQGAIAASATRVPSDKFMNKLRGAALDDVRYLKRAMSAEVAHGMASLEYNYALLKCKENEAKLETQLKHDKDFIVWVSTQFAAKYPEHAKKTHITNFAKFRAVTASTFYPLAPYDVATRHMRKFTSHGMTLSILAATIHPGIALAVPIDLHRQLARIGKAWLVHACTLLSMWVPGLYDFGSLLFHRVCLPAMNAQPVLVNMASMGEDQIAKRSIDWYITVPGKDVEVVAKGPALEAPPLDDVNAKSHMKDVRRRVADEGGDVATLTPVVKIKEMVGSDEEVDDMDSDGDVDMEE